jgi:hypothetical protein
MPDREPLWGCADRNVQQTFLRAARAGKVTELTIGYSPGVLGQDRSKSGAVPQL